MWVSALVSLAKHKLWFVIVFLVWAMITFRPVCLRTTLRLEVEELGTQLSRQLLECSLLFCFCRSQESQLISTTLTSHKIRIEIFVPSRFFTKQFCGKRFVWSYNILLFYRYVFFRVLDWNDLVKGGILHPNLRLSL